MKLLKTVTFSLFYEFFAQCPLNIIKAVGTYPFQVPKPIQVDDYGTVVCSDGLINGSICKIICDGFNIKYKHATRRKIIYIYSEKTTDNYQPHVFAIQIKKLNQKIN